MNFCQCSMLMGTLAVMLAAAGCRIFGSAIADPSQQIEVTATKAGSNETVVIPQAQDDPQKLPPAPVKPPQAPAPAVEDVREKPATPVAEKPVSPAQKEKGKEKKNPANPAKKDDCDKHFPPRSPENYRRGRGAWRAFSRLSLAEQEELMKLQRTDPKKFEAIMREKADQLYEAEKKRREEQADLASKYHTETDPAKRAEIKALLRQKIKEDFSQRLQDTRRDIESNKRRTAQMEKELQKRELKSEAIVDAILNHRLHKKDAKAPVKPAK